MINTDRIVSVTDTDLITLYSRIFAMASVTVAKLAATALGTFKVTDGTSALLCAEPAKVIDIDATASSVSAATIYFVPAYDYEGFTIDGVKVTPTGSVDKDPGALYKAVLATGAITITKDGQ